MVILCVFYGTVIFDAILPADTDTSLALMGGIVLFFLMVGETINGGFGIADLPVIYRSPLFNPVISLAMIPVYIFLTYLFTQYTEYGPVGVAMALCSTYLLMNLIRVAVIKKLFSINLLSFKVFKVIIAALVTTGIFKMLKDYLPIDVNSGLGIAVGVALLFIIYGLCLLLIAMEKKDIEKIKARFL